MLTHWLDSNLEDCDRMVETIPDLDDIEVTPGWLSCLSCYLIIHSLKSKITVNLLLHG